MGEIARREILNAAKEGFILNGEITKELETPHRFYTKYISEIEK